MIRSLLLLGVLSAQACASAAPPAGPKHVPSNSAESTTPCPEQRRKAQTARENLLGADMGGEKGAALDRAVAEAVLRHADCEASAIAALPSPAGNHDQLLAGLRAIRQQIQDANNLFREVQRYNLGTFAIRASLGEASLKLNFARIVSNVAPPENLQGRGRSAFEAELAETYRVLRLEASGLLETALDAIATTPEASEWKARACELWTETGTSPAAFCQ